MWRTPELPDQRRDLVLPGVLLLTVAITILSVES
jgi:hypothetical protein